jgi:hypothetical protein
MAQRLRVKVASVGGVCWRALPIGAQGHQKSHRHPGEPFWLVERL